MKPDTSTVVLLAAVPEAWAAQQSAVLTAHGYRVLRAETHEDVGSLVEAFPEVRAILLDRAALATRGAKAAGALQSAAPTSLVLMDSQFTDEPSGLPGQWDGCQFYQYGSGDFLLLAAVRKACASHQPTSRIREDHGYTELVSEMHQGVAIHEAILDPSGRMVDYRFLNCNPSFERITGLSRGQIIGRTVREAIPGGAPPWLEHYAAVVKTGEIRHFEDFSEHLGKHFELTAYRPQAGQFAVVINDVTERKSIESRIFQERRVFERLIETSPAGILMANKTGQVTLSNARADAIFNINSASPKLRQYNAPEWRLTSLSGDPFPDNQLAFAQVRDALAPHYNIQHAVVWPDGRRVLISVNAAPLFDASGEFDGMVATVNDITTRVHTDNVLRVSEDRFRNLADNGMALIWAAGSERRCTFFNKPWLEFTRRTLQQELGIGWMEGVHPDDREHCLNTYRLAWNERLRFSMDYRLKRWDGVYRWIQDDGVPCFDSTGMFTGYIGHCLDITDHKLAISRINILLSEKDLLLKEVHHRIKNNMSSIMGLLALQSQKLQNPVVSKALDSAISRIRSMSLLYDKLYRTPEFRQISLREYLPSLVSDIRHTYPRTPQVSFDLQVENVVVSVNTVVPLGIIVNELINNAMKYAFTGRTAGSIVLSAAKETGNLVIRVSDDGPGLPPSFDPAQSTGFGLQLCKQLSREMGGGMETSGATYTITIPL